MTLEPVATMPMLRRFDEAGARDVHCGFPGVEVGGGRHVTADDPFGNRIASVEDPS